MAIVFQRHLVLTVVTLTITALLKRTRSSWKNIAYRPVYVLLMLMLDCNRLKALPCLVKKLQCYFVISWNM